jgi:hypothetical protein
MKLKSRQVGLALVLVLTLSCSLMSPLFAQTKPNFIHRHPTATALAAGAGTTYMLKRSAHYKRMHGQHLSFAERHPYMSGMGVAVVTHHVLKKHPH